MGPKISAILIVKNEARIIRRCLESVKWVDEIVVMDQSSTDDTVAICRQYTDKVFVVESKGYCEPDRPVAASKAQNDWILCLDADEVVTPELKEEIESVLRGPARYNSYLLPRKNIFLGKEIKGSGWHPSYALRLFKKGFVKFPEKIHAVIEPVGEAGYLKHELIHYTCEDIEEYLQKANRYTSVLAKEAYEKGKRITAGNFFYSMGILPSLYFVYKFIYKKGFVDGFQGFLIAWLTAYTIFFMNVKLWQMQKGFLSRS